MPICVSVEIQLPLIEIVLRLFKMCRNRNSIASHRNSSKTIPKCVLAEIQLHLIENILRQFQILY